MSHYVYGVFYGAGSYTFGRDQIFTRYLFVGLRTLLDPNDANDVSQAHALQDAVKVTQQSPGRFEVPDWDRDSQKKVRDALKVLGESLPDLRRAFGRRDEVDPVRHLIATATAWGGNPEKDATYLNVTPAKNDGKTVYVLKVRDVPVDAFWSITVYNAEGFLEPNPQNRCNVNSITAKRDADGAVAIQFGGCDGKTKNCLPIMPGWNYLVRLYRPRPEILNRTFTFPEAVPQAAVREEAP
jgi:hypothetical protein